MRRAWVVLLAGCGFQSQALPMGQPDAAPPDAVVIVDTPDGATCWRLDGATIHVLACTTQTIANVEINGNVDIDTDTGASTPAGYGCAPLTDGSEPLCAITGDKVTIASGRVVAHGSKPFAILAHEIDLRGAIDVASHISGVRGAGAVSAQCNVDSHGAIKSGGGAGGGFGSSGGKGGDEGSEPSSGALGGHTLGANFRGGCDGTGGGNGTATGQPRGTGGAGGGVVWLAADVRPFTIADTALINASGAAGAGGAMPSYGGGGGGSGGLIVLQAPTITRGTAQIFANGGHGGGGAVSDDPGQDGGDPERPSSGGSDGHGGGHGAPSTHAGDGGSGVGGSGVTEAGTNNDGKPGGAPDAGGGGGGGGLGVIWVASLSSIGTSNVSPDPIAVP